MSKAANIQVQGVEFTVDGAKHRLVYDINAMISLEEKYENLDSAIKGMIRDDENRTLDPKIMRDVFWAGLLHDEPDITLQQAGAMMDVKYLSEIYVAIVMATVAALPDTDKEEPDDPS